MQVAGGKRRQSLAGKHFRSTYSIYAQHYIRIQNLNPNLHFMLF